MSVTDATPCPRPEHRSICLCLTLGLPILAQQSSGPGRLDRRHAVDGSQLAEDRRDMVSDSALRQMQSVGDRMVGRAGGQLIEHLLLAPRQAGRVGQRRSPWAARGPGTCGGPLAPERSTRRAGAEPVQNAQSIASGAIIAPHRRQSRLVGCLRLGPGLDRSAPVAFKFVLNGHGRAIRQIEREPEATPRRQTRGSPSDTRRTRPVPRELLRPRTPLVATSRPQRPG